MVGQQRGAGSRASQVVASGDRSGRLLSGRKRRESLVSCCDHLRRLRATSQYRLGPWLSWVRNSRAVGLTTWDHHTEGVKVKIDRNLISLPLQAGPSVLERERLAVLARDAANVSKFRVTGSLRTS